MGLWKTTQSAFFVPVEDTISSRYKRSLRLEVEKSVLNYATKWLSIKCQIIVYVLDYVELRK